jgi:hypothetical protein
LSNAGRPFSFRSFLFLLSSSLSFLSQLSTVLWNANAPKFDEHMYCAVLIKTCFFYIFIAYHER